MITYGITQISSKSYGVFLRPRKVFQGKYTNGFYTGATAGIISADHRASVIKALFMDLPINATALTAIASAVLNKVNVVDVSTARSFDTDGITTGSAGDVIVLFVGEHTNAMTIADDDTTANSFTTNGDNQGVVLYTPDGTSWYIYDTVFIPVGVAQEQPKINTEKGEEVKDSYSNKLLTGTVTSIEAISMQLDPDSMEFLNAIAEAETDFALFEHSSKGNAGSSGTNDGLLICSGATIAAVSLGTGKMVKEINIVPKLLFSGNAQNTITLSASKDFNVSERGIVSAAQYVTVAS